MKLLLIRHADPDYEHDSLTPVGEREAEYLAEYLENREITAFYCSPLGRARCTAEHTLRRMGREAEIHDFLREFEIRIDRDGTGQGKIPWDMLPDVWTAEPSYFDPERWTQVPVMAAADMAREAARVYEGIDGLLARHGYVREGKIYRAQRPNEETIAVFCHFGVTALMLAHILSVSPMVLWHGMVSAPSSITTLVTEERRMGVASLRMTGFGETPHLALHGEAPSFSARFCERYTNWDQRHD